MCFSPSTPPQVYIEVTEGHREITADNISKDKISVALRDLDVDYSRELIGG
jgi:hypothetical protein